MIRDRRAGRGGPFATSADSGAEKRWEHLVRLAGCADRCWRLGYDGKESCSACFSPMLVELAIPLEQHLMARAGDSREARELARALVSDQARYMGGGKVYFPRPTERLDARMREAQIWHARHAQGLSIRVIAQLIGRSEAQVYRLLASARRRYAAHAPDFDARAHCTRHDAGLAGLALDHSARRAA